MRQEFVSESVIGAARQPGMAQSATFIDDTTELRTSALASLRRFHAVLERGSMATAEEWRADLEALRLLKRDMPTTLARLEMAAEPGDFDLVAALREATAELAPLETEIRQRLGGARSNGESGYVDLDALRGQLAERAARRELGGSSGVGTVPTLEIAMRRSSMAGIPMLVFGTGWLSFTTFHAIMMIGGLSRAIGWAALFLLAFYSIFFMVGFGMLWGGITQFRKEELILAGASLTVRYTLFGYSWDKVYSLDAQSRAWVATPAVQQKGARIQEIAILTGEGKEIRVGNGLPDPILYQESDRINDYVHRLFAIGR
ncbi:MAG: hypothetical protein SFU56_17435 [Capsulimonadales bacterium]|nr:hypothetical protein [Capsulimonadales bacterium]